MEEGPGAVTLLLYTAAVYPITCAILKTKRLPPSRSLWAALGFVAAVGIAKTAWEWHARGPNYYQLLGVGREAKPLEIKRAYKAASLELHPDKNPGDPEAAAKFFEMKAAYDVLMDQEFRCWDKPKFVPVAVHTTHLGLPGCTLPFVWPANRCHGGS